MQKQDQKSDVIMLDQTEQIQIEGGYDGNDGGCIPNPGPKLPDFPTDILY